jgi:guanylate kinase
MTTRQEAIAAAGRVVAEDHLAQAARTVEEAARAAYTPTGPSIEELERRIRARRENTQTAQTRRAATRRASA